MKPGCRGQAVIEALICLPLALMFLYLILAAGFRTVYSALIDEWSEDYLLCRISVSHSCEKIFKQRLRTIGHSSIKLRKTNNGKFYEVSVHTRSAWGDSLFRHRSIDAEKTLEPPERVRHNSIPQLAPDIFNAWYAQ